MVQPIVFNSNTTPTHQSQARRICLTRRLPPIKVGNPILRISILRILPIVGTMVRLYYYLINLTKSSSVQWSPTLKGVLMASSFDRSVQILSFINTKHREKSWFGRKCGHFLNFDGKVISFNSNESVVQIKPSVIAPVLSTRIRKFYADFHQAILNDQSTGEREFLQAFCLDKANRVEDVVDKQIWRFLAVLFTKNTRIEVAKFLGYDDAEIARERLNR